MLSLINKFILSVCLGLSLHLSAQQTAQYSQYLFNGSVINPAYAAVNNTIEGHIIHRQQWKGIEGLPVTSGLGFSSALKESSAAFGANYVNDQLGLSQLESFMVSYSYKVPFEKIDVHLGLQGGIFSLSHEWSQVLTIESGDEAFQAGDQTSLNANFGLGLIVKSKSFFLSASIPQIREQNFYTDGEQLGTLERHLFVHMAYARTMNSNWVWKPSMLFKNYFGGTPLFDLNMEMIRNERLFVGMSYRVNIGLVFMGQLQISNHLMVGYSYDSDTTVLQRYHSGTHEIFVKVFKSRSHEKTYSPRYF